MDSYPESPMDQEDVYPCKGCGETLEEGKAFELAGNRWHIDCFRCNTCGTLLDSDANLLLLGDGSLICNNCTYSCSACGNKIEDLAILTGDQAFCASCFRCRNCKKKIENLRYARTSQGIFCMECHEGLMARRRKKSKNPTIRRKPSSQNTMLLDKSLPSLPPNAVPQSAFSPDHETPPSDTYSDTPTELPTPVPSTRSTTLRSNNHREQSPAPSEEVQKDNLTLPSTTYHRHSTISQLSELSTNGDDFYIPMALDPTPVPGPSPMTRHQKYQAQDETPKPSSRDYFTTKVPHSSSRKASQDQENIRGTSHPTSRPESRGNSQPSSPHVAYQEKGREPSAELIDTIRKRSVSGITNVVGNTLSIDRDVGPRNARAENEKFTLQEVPKRRKSGSSARNSRSDIPATAIDTKSIDPKSKSAPASATTQTREQQMLITSNHPELPRSDSMNTVSPHLPQDPKMPENGVRDITNSQTSPKINQIPNLPQRGDSLQKPGKQPVVSRKEVSGGSKLGAHSSTAESPVAAPSSSTQESPTSSTNLNGGRTISRPMESPVSKSSLDFMQPPAQGKDRPPASANAKSDSFVSPRPPPHPPMELLNGHRAKADSISTLQSESTRNGDPPSSPSLPNYNAGGEFNMAEDMARIMGSDEMDHASFLRRVSNSVRHARSHSDRGTRLSKEHKWPKSPLNGTAANDTFSHENSPINYSPGGPSEIAWVRDELQRERQRGADKEKKIAQLEATLEGKTSIKQMNTELREKRSTMIVLDTQKEIVVRELEVLTDHIAAAKKSREPLNLDSMRNVVVKEFAEALERLKNSFAPQIEDLTEQRNNLLDEVANLTQQKEKSFLEFEQLSLKNAQLAELNNSLVHQIQELYKVGIVPPSEVSKPQQQQQQQQQQQYHGLGIYTHHPREKSSLSMDSRDMRPSISEGGSIMGQEHDAEPATVLTAPQMVNIRKGQPKKFNWKKGGQTVAKGVTKGLKGAFASNETKTHREGSITEGVPYGAMSEKYDYPTTTLPRALSNDPARQGFGFFGNPKGKPGPQQKAMSNGSSATIVPENASVLYGSELEQRAEFERVGIPGIITRCIQEVELRGMDVEGIYRKSGGNSQIQQIKEGFEHSNDFDISDPDLDINAVTSSLKQYFRRLPTPLITYSVYDMLLDSTSTNDEASRIAMMRAAISELPSRHKDCLEFLVFHLARVVEREKENLMTSLNVAVVFAPTIMRPESISREMSDTQAKNAAIQFLIENCHSVFMGEG